MGTWASRDYFTAEGRQILGFTLGLGQYGLYNLGLRVFRVLNFGFRAYGLRNPTP